MYVELCSVALQWFIAQNPHLSDLFPFSFQSTQLFLGHKLTARRAQEMGLVSESIWPATYQQELIPKVALLATHSAQVSVLSHFESTVWSLPALHLLDLLAGWHQDNHLGVILFFMTGDWCCYIYHNNSYYKWFYVFSLTNTVFLLVMWWMCIQTDVMCALMLCCGAWYHDISCC